MALERHAGRLWVASGGGPLLVLERRLLPAWGGLETGDYDRACATTSEVEDIGGGDGRGLILGDEPAMTAAVERADGVAFVRWHAADDVHAVERAILQLQKAAILDGRPAGITFDIMDRELVVFDSVEPGLEQSRSLSGGDLAKDPSAYRSRPEPTGFTLANLIRRSVACRSSSSSHEPSWPDTAQHAAEAEGRSRSLVAPAA